MIHVYSIHFVPKIKSKTIVNYFDFCSILQKVHLHVFFVTLVNINFKFFNSYIFFIIIVIFTDAHFKVAVYRQW